MKIALDMLGGDYAPKECTLGVRDFISKNNQAHLVLIGNESDIQKDLSDSELSRCTIVHTSDAIDMHEHPVKAMKEKPNASMNIGFSMLAKGDVDAFVSAGNTGVMLVGAAHIIKTIDGVLRPTIPSIVPKVNGQFGIMCDVGINADCKPENLNQFATLAYQYTKEIMGIANPRVALLNIGEEEGKGNILAQATYPLLKENQHINFIGNIEGRDLFTDNYDVVICDGFTGNIVLKLCESIYDVVVKERNLSDEFLLRFNHQLYGGVPVLGINKPVVVGHGISDASSFSGMLQVAEKMISTNILGNVSRFL
ncbi:MAG: phosphate acyltransferase PlsX [Chitinophagaceae bacterium]